jgi:hypothetical protein
VGRLAQLFPGDVAGVLYLDSFYEDIDAYMPERLHLARVRQPYPGPVQLSLMRPMMRRMYKRMFAGWPDGVPETLVGRRVMAGRAGPGLSAPPRRSVRLR